MIAQVYPLAPLYYPKAARDAACTTPPGLCILVVAYTIYSGSSRRERVSAGPAALATGTPVSTATGKNHAAFAP
jgi:hypothetical protein